VLDISYKYRLIILFLIALVASMIVYNPILKIAKSKNIVDNPDARKVQKTPIPVMGGIAVFFGIVVGLCFYKTMTNFTILFPVLSAIVVMLYLGSIDDILNINPSLRFFIEVCVSLLLIYGLKIRISDFQGLWGIDHISLGLGVVLSVVTFVGITNSINMIDGVDGLSSSFCIMILGFLGVCCFLAHAYSFAVLSAVSIGAILPFFIHNVYGKDSKMFIGDGGTMMMGTIISSMIFTILSPKFEFSEHPEWNFSRIAFVLAVLSIPIADTLRVMFVRMYHRQSPFHPDKTHFHHILMKYHFSHSFISFIEITLNLMVIGIWFIVWLCGAPVNWQLYSVVISAALLNWSLAFILSREEKKNSNFTRKVIEYADKKRGKKSGFLLKLQNIIDGFSK